MAGLESIWESTDYGCPDSKPLIKIASKTRHAALGLQYRPTEQWRINAGVAFDSTVYESQMMLRFHYLPAMSGVLRPVRSIK